MRNYVQEGKALDLMAPAGGVIAGLGYFIGGIFVVASTTAAEGEPFVGLRVGVFDLAATAHATDQAMSAGDVAYFNTGTDKVTKTAAGNQTIGVLVDDKASTATTAKVVLVPTAFQLGTAIADLAGGADLAATIAKVNAIIAALEGKIILGN